MRKALLIGLMGIVIMGIFSSSAFAAIKLKGGYFMPAESQDVDGEKFPENGIIYGAEITTTLFGGFLGLGVGVDYFQFKKTVSQEEMVLEHLPIYATLYLSPGSKFYLGAGAGYYGTRVEVTPQPDGWPESDASTRNIGYHAVIGYNITKFLFIEGKYSTCRVEEWKSGDEVVEEIEISDVGGIQVMLGISI